MATRVDLHCHSSASAVSRLGVQRALGLPECATPPEEVYELAKRRGMDFVTITDHDTIDGALAIADRPDAFISEELTASFHGEPQAVHVLCFGITPEDHEWLQAHAGDVEACAEYLDANRVVSALAHPFYAVGAPLASRHRRRLAELFPIWETRNGSRAPELNMPAMIYVETQGGIGVGGSDDHAGRRHRAHVYARAGSSDPRGVPRARARRPRRARRRAGQRPRSGHMRRWHWRSAHSDRTASTPSSSPARVLEIAERVLRDGDRRAGPVPSATWRRPTPARCCAPGLSRSVSTSSRRQTWSPTCRTSASRTPISIDAPRARTSGDCATPVATAIDAAGRGEHRGRSAAVLFTACMPAIPYAPAAAFIARERAKLAAARGRAPAGRDRRRRHRRDARRHPHDRGDPRARRRRVSRSR